MKKYLRLLFTLWIFGYGCAIKAQEININGKPVRLEIRLISNSSLRVTLIPKEYKQELPTHPSVIPNLDVDKTITFSELENNQTTTIGDFKLVINKKPFSIKFYGKENNIIQKVTFLNNGNVEFITGDSPILGMGEGGPKPSKEDDWRTLPIEFDRRGRYHKMQPRWQSDAYGSRNPVPFLIGTSGWGIFVVSPWVEIDLTDPKKGIFIPESRNEKNIEKQTEKNQHKSLGKGLPPINASVNGLFDFFVLNGNNPKKLMKDISSITGPAIMPPIWAMGYMQSHRTLKDENQLIEIVDSFRTKEIPIDAVIYLGTGFTPRGWNTMQPSFDFNPDVFKRDGASVIKDLHERNVKVVMHMVPWDRNKLPTLQGTIPPKKEEIIDDSHIKSYWKQHINLVKSGVDAFWPDEGDWFDLHERIKRHQLYYQGPLFSTPDIRPWSLHRNGYLGIAQWGGWVWSGDTQSAWKTLEGQISVGINHSISISPFWGSDIGGFYPNPDKTGEMYARWFQFGAFTPSFRSHGRTWHTSLPWGFGLKDMGEVEANNNNNVSKEVLKRNSPSPDAMNNFSIEPITKKYAELRYQLLPYNYTLCWEARNSGMPLMRALWLHYPEDKEVKKIGDEYLWGPNMLIAPIYRKGVSTRKVYLPEGIWYDWWTNDKFESTGKYFSKKVDLATMPIYVPAGAIIPFDPVRQYTSDVINTPMTIRVYTGSDGNFTLYEDDGNTLNYLKENYNLIKFTWDNNKRKLIIKTTNINTNQAYKARNINVMILPEGIIKQVKFDGTLTEINLN